jgi:hypothetical protein
MYVGTVAISLQQSTVPPYNWWLPRKHAPYKLLDPDEARLVYWWPDVRHDAPLALTSQHNWTLRASPGNWLPMRTHSSVASPEPYAHRRTFGCPGGLTHLQARRKWGHSCATNYPGTIKPVAGRPRHIAPDQMAHRRMDPARHRRQPTPQRPSVEFAPPNLAPQITLLQWRTRELCSGCGRVQQIQLRTEGRENGDLGSVAP